MDQFKLQFLITVLFCLGSVNAVGKCYAPVDLGFLIDESGTIGQASFKKNMIGFLKEAGKQYFFSPTDGFQAGVIKFGTGSRVEMHFDTCDNYKCFLREVNKLRYSAGYTRIDLAFKQANNKLFQTQRGYRGGTAAGFPAYALLISDGGQNPWSNPPSKNKDVALANAKALKNRGVKVIAFGLIDTRDSDDINLHEPLLKKMASPGLYYRVDGVTDLLNQLDELFGAICKEKSCVQDGSDAVLVVDTSNRASYLNQEREIAKDIVGQYDIKQGGNKVGLVSYGSTATSAGYYHDADTFSQKLDGLSMESASPHIDLALGEAARLLASSLAKNKALYLFTDGFLEDSLNPTQAVATAGTLKESGVKIIIVAMGTSPTMPYLRLLTNKENIVRAPSGENPAIKAVKISCKAPGPKCYTVLKEQRICPPTPTPSTK